VRITKPITLVGQRGSEIRGSDVWRRWTKKPATGGFQSASTLPKFPQEDVSCDPHTKQCAWPEQVFINGTAQKQVGPNSDPRPGQFKVDSNRRVILGSDPTGKTVEVTVRRHWITGASSADGVTVQGFTMKHAANEWRSGAIQSRQPTTRNTNGSYAWSRFKPDGKDWNIKNNTLSYAHGAIVSVRSANADISGNEIFRGGQLGIHNLGSNSRLSGNYIHHNNAERFCLIPHTCAGYSTDGDSRVSATLVEAGGVKIAGGQDFVTVSSNEISHNHGNGLWFDADTRNIVASSNRVHHNTRRGIFFEMSNGAKIFSNVIYENGSTTAHYVDGAGISTQSSSNVEIYNNTLAWNAEGIAVIALDREGTRYDVVHDVYIHDNKVLGTNSRDRMENHIGLAWLQVSSPRPLTDPANNNRGANNKYWYSAKEGSLERFMWGTRAIDKLAEFNATLGEENGRYLTQSEKDAILRQQRIPPGP
jgi:parallel beta-helix repeat protein